MKLSEKLKEIVLTKLWLDDSEKLSQGKCRYLCNAILNNSPHATGTGILLEMIREDTEPFKKPESVYGSFPRNFDDGGESQLQVAVYGLLLAEYIRTDYVAQ